MKKQIGEIAIISSGVYSQFGQFGSAIYLQANYFNDYGQLKKNIKPNLVLNRKTEKHLLKEGDVLFAAKGRNNFAVSIKDKIGACVASSTFLVLRIKEEFKNSINPSFLVWFLNNPHSQSYLKSKAIGTGLPSISKKVLEEMEFFIPHFSTQQNIVIIDTLRAQERQLKTKIEKLKEKQIQQLLINLTTEKIKIDGK